MSYNAPSAKLTRALDDIESVLQTASSYHLKDELFDMIFRRLDDIQMELYRNEAPIHNSKHP